MKHDIHPLTSCFSGGGYNPPITAADGASIANYIEVHHSLSPLTNTASNNAAVPLQFRVVEDIDVVHCSFFWMYG